MRTREAAYLSAVAEIGCVLCEQLGRPDTPAQIHHVREGQGMSQRAQNYLTVPLCPSCHTGPHGIHGDRQLLRQAKVDEMDLLALTIERMNDERRT
jgi:hypothetical protein